MKSIRGITEATLSKYVKMLEKAGVKNARPRSFRYKEDFPNEKLVLKYEFFHQKKDLGKMLKENSLERDLLDTIIGFYDLNFYLVAVNEGTDMETLRGVLPIDSKVDFKKLLMSQTNYDKIRGFIEGDVQRCIFALNIDFGLYNRAISRGMRGGHPYLVRGDIAIDLYYIFVNTLDLMRGKGGVGLYDEPNDGGYEIDMPYDKNMIKRLKKNRMRFRKKRWSTR